MTRIPALFAAAFFVLPAATALADHEDDRTEIALAQALDEAERIDQILAQLCHHRRHRGREVCEELRGRVHVLKRHIRQARRAERREDRSYERPGRGRRGDYYRPSAMDDGTFAQLRAELHNAHFDHGKRELLRHQAGYAYFTSAQVRVLVESVTFSSTKREVLRILAPRIVDPENAFTIYSAFTFQSDRRAAQTILAEAIRS